MTKKRLSREETLELKRRAYMMAIAEGATNEEAQEMSEKAWMWLDRRGNVLPLSESPLVKKPSWWRP